MVEETLAFARDAAAEEETTALDLRALADSLAEDRRAAGEDVAVAGGPPVILRGRRTALTRALDNLIGNAVRYGGRARVGLDVTATAVRITVDDAGPGIPEAELARVFEPFVRLETSRSRDTGGIGLGLAVARTLIHAHGGTIALANRPEGGLRATLELPRGGVPG
jgi:signal transduction histidine kinase